MLFWCAMLFCLGLAAFTDSLFNYGEIFRQINSVVFMLVSLGLLVRTTTKMRQGTREKIHERLGELEREVNILRDREEREKTNRRPASRMSA